MQVVSDNDATIVVSDDDLHVIKHEECFITVRFVGGASKLQDPSFGVANVNVEPIIEEHEDASTGSDTSDDSGYEQYNGQGMSQTCQNIRR